ncbi:MAG TPA: tetratricopeptide repeat protein [Terriglobales bacterium]|nr:tetratricopeptide repeat protein [Terriglobales bacterium]
MALFGFNKQKVLATAEKYVQQGKMQNAISEYEKILKNDAKDLTVTNTVGDLYSRLGEVDKAADCFKNVGDAYASQGFTVKAIAMYKKISKLKPSLESLLKLAELYTQQGLFNDARAQYLQVAEEFLKANELDNAVRIFQKILEMDPENSSMRVRLAEVYIRLGKKTEAWQIFSAAAESLRSKGSLSGAEEILQRMLTLDPGNTYALLMQGKNLIESGDAVGAAVALQKISDIDSHPDGLRDLLKAYLQSGQLSEAGAVANKLLTVHNDLPAISSFAEALMQAGQFENALQVYDQHAERLLAENSDKVLEHLHSIIGHVRENPDSLQKLLDLFNKAGETTHVGEVLELLAHASVQSGDLPRARDLYQKLAQIEPQNPLHMQNYQQVVSQLGGTSGSKLITPEEAVVLIDDLEATAPSVHQHYSDEVALTVRSALTDAELFISYNMPQKALGPLLSALPLAPSDLRLNQRLAALHTRASRFAEAALCCRTLQTVYSDAGYPEEATRYGELAERYDERSSTQSLVAPSEEEAHIFLDATPHVDETVNEVAEFSVDDASAEAPAAEDEIAVEPAAAWPAASNATETVDAEPEFAVVDESASASPDAAAAAPTGGEIDLSSEWDDSVTVETDAPAEVAEEVPEKPAAVKTAAAHHRAADPAKVDETVDEIRFYVAHGMPEQALAALAKLQTLTHDQAKIDELRAEVEAATEPAAEEAEIAVEPVIEEITADDIPSADVEIANVEVEAAASEAPAALEEPAALEPEPVAEPPVVEEIPVVAASVEDVPEPAAIEPEPVAAEAETAPGVLKDFVSDLESSLGDGFLPGTVTKPVETPATPPAKAPAIHAPAAQRATAAASKSAAAKPIPSPAPVLGEFVADIEASLGEDFLKGAPVAEPKPKVPAPASAKVTPPLAASAAASAAPSAHIAPPALPSPVGSVAWSAPAAPAPALPIAPAPAAKASASPFAEEAGVDLAEMFGELKQDLESGVTAADEDPETHYNLGIAFREMGLLDEAIGELQKACQSFDNGHPFPQIMQTYTWLAQCFLEKGVPEAAVRWYDKALHVPGIDGETRVALHYELASAYETAGDKPSALKHFMDVYGTNIDYRDVAERIKALKS